MFKNKSNSDFAPAEVASPNSTSLVGAGTTIKGDITSSSNMRIDGTIIGNINSTAKVIIGPNGKVEGDIIAQQADVVGKITGNVTVKELLQLKDNSVVNGNIAAGKLQVEPNASFNGNCHMIPAGVVQMTETSEEEADAVLTSGKKEKLALAK